MGVPSCCQRGDESRLRKGPKGKDKNPQPTHHQGPQGGALARPLCQEGVIRRKRQLVLVGGLVGYLLRREGGGTAGASKWPRAWQASTSFRTADLLPPVLPAVHDNWSDRGKKDGS